MKLKLCGIRRIEDVQMINNAAPDYAGFIFWPKSRRYISPADAKILRVSLSRGIKAVGVFVNEAPEKVAQAARTAQLDVVQLHGDENENYISRLRRLYAGEIWKAVGVVTADDVRRASQLSADMLLFDAFDPEQRGGTGKRINLSAITGSGVDRPYFLAGGINAMNVREILDTVIPYGIDVSSGFEVDGVKNKQKLAEFLETIAHERKDKDE
ncbi:MAG: phosphoribosylanthranilate isomerase [Oscillospiraceae bacterium]|nr:phosphoribosylanthranilate isomerase [Oscillospiraceae bacterium]